MYTILNNNTAVINCDDLQTAMRFVRSLESGLNRWPSACSPYTIVKSDTLDTTAAVNATISKRELYTEVA